MRPRFVWGSFACGSVSHSCCDVLRAKGIAVLPLKPIFSHFSSGARRGTSDARHPRTTRSSPRTLSGSLPHNSISHRSPHRTTGTIVGGSALHSNSDCTGCPSCNTRSLCREGGPYGWIYGGTISRSCGLPVGTSAHMKSSTLTSVAIFFLRKMRMFACGRDQSFWDTTSTQHATVSPKVMSTLTSFTNAASFSWNMFAKMSGLSAGLSLSRSAAVICGHCKLHVNASMRSGFPNFRTIAVKSW